MVEISNGFSAHNNMDKEERKVMIERDGDGEVDLKVDTRREDDDDDDDEKENFFSFEQNDAEDDNGVDFKPIEHPMEPPEDDQPAKCPSTPEFTFIYDTRKELLTEPRRSAERLVPNEANIKKTERLVQNEANIKKPRKSNPAYYRLPQRAPQHNFFDVFQQCKEFGFS